MYNDAHGNHQKTTNLRMMIIEYHRFIAYLIGSHISMAMGQESTKIGSTYTISLRPIVQALCKGISPQNRILDFLLNI